MEPGVPFALLGVVVLLAVTGWTGLAVAAVVRSGRRGTRAPAVVLSVGCLVLAVVECALLTTDGGFGRSSSELLPLVRAAGAVLVAAGLYSGALASRRRRSGAAASGAAGVVVPLAAAPTPAAVAALAGVATVLAAVRTRRDGPGLLLAAGLLLSAAASALAPVADSPGGALAVLLSRGAGALLLLLFLGALAQASLLGKVVAVVLAGVLLTATAAVGVVGTVVVHLYEREQATLVRDAADTRVSALATTLTGAQGIATIAAAACGQTPGACTQVLQRLSPPSQQTFAMQIGRGTARALGGRAPLNAAEVVGLASSSPVRAVLTGSAGRISDEGLPSAVRVVGGEPGLALVVVVPTARARPDAEAATEAFVYGIRLDDAFVGTDDEAGDFRLAFLVDGSVSSSNLSPRQEQRVQRIAERARVGSSLADAGRTIRAEGSDPTVHFRPVVAFDGRPVGVIAVSRLPKAALEAQRTAITALLAAALAATAVIGAVALLLGRRTVDPVRRLTAAASRVAAGDLTVTTSVAGRDEVGTLSRTFDTMTASVSRLTGDLQASAARLDTVLSSMSDGLVATGADGSVTSINRAALEMVGLARPEEALGRPLAEVVDVRVGGEALHLGGEQPDVPAEVHRDDGTTVPVRVAVARLQDAGEDGQRSGSVLVLRDTTQEREVERMKTEFLSNVSHELRTPLTPIRGYAEILVGKPGLSADKVTRFATTIRDESIKMNRVVDLLVDVAAIEAGRVHITPRPVAPSDLVDARLEAWRARAPERARDLKRRVAARLPQVDVDPTWIGKALDELVDNAVKYTLPGTAITLVAALSPAGDRVRVGVRDAGPGIAAADQESLFLSFEQVDGSATRRVGGLGLGLSFVRRLAQDAGFPLTVSSSPGRGAEFTLDLPIADLPAPVLRRRRSTDRKA